MCASEYGGSSQQLHFKPAKKFTHTDIGRQVQTQQDPMHCIRGADLNWFAEIKRLTTRSCGNAGASGGNKCLCFQSHSAEP
jgi:hypothetical protein